MATALWIGLYAAGGFGWVWYRWPDVEAYWRSRKDGRLGSYLIGVAIGAAIWPACLGLTLFFESALWGARKFRRPPEDSP